MSAPDVEAPMAGVQRALDLLSRASSEWRNGGSCDSGALHWPVAISLARRELRQALKALAKYASVPVLRATPATVATHCAGDRRRPRGPAWYNSATVTERRHWPGGCFSRDTRHRSSSSPDRARSPGHASGFSFQGVGRLFASSSSIIFTASTAFLATASMFDPSRLSPCSATNAAKICAAIDERSSFGVIAELSPDGYLSGRLCSFAWPGAATELLRDPVEFAGEFAIYPG